MKKSKNINYKILFLFLFLFLNVNYIYPQNSKWGISNDGWVLKKTSFDDTYNPFFAIGSWGVTDYTFTPYNKNTQTENFKKSKELFTKNTQFFNLVIAHSSYIQDYMGNIVCMPGTSEIPWYITQYISKKNKGNDIFKNMPYIENELSNKNSNLKNTINNAVTSIQDQFSKNKNLDFIWAPIDEVWKYSPKLTEYIYSQIKLKAPNSIVYTDLLGNGKIKPYKDKDKNAILYNEKEAFDTFEKQWYENIYQTAIDYKNSGDVFGVNSYGDFYKNPVLAGVTVDAIKAATNNKPVWLYFDITGYAKPLNISIDNYLNNVKCQIYTSIIHGATGVMFWNNKQSNNVFNKVLPLIKEINKMERVFKLQTIKTEKSGDTQYIVKDEGNGKKYIIAVNLNKKEKSNLKINNKKVILKPFQVYIGKY